MLAEFFINSIFYTILFSTCIRPQEKIFCNNKQKEEFVIMWPIVLSLIQDNKHIPNYYGYVKFCYCESSHIF